MLPFIIFVILAGIVFAPLCLTYKGRVIFSNKRISIVLRQFSKKKKGFAIKNVLLPYSVTGKTPDFNHILITTSGIYIISLRYFNGKISGKKNQTKWIWYNKKDKTDKKIANPLIIDPKRIKLVSSMLGINNNVFSCVVFAQGKIKDVDAPVLTIRKLYKTIASRKKQKVFSKEQLKKFYDIISKYKDKQVNTFVTNEKCPLCKQQLNVVVKNKKYVITCKNPKCKFKKKV